MLSTSFFHRYFKAIPGSIWSLGFVSMFTDMSSELIHRLLPYFMLTILVLVYLPVYCGITLAQSILLQ